MHEKGPVIDDVTAGPMEDETVSASGLTIVKTERGSSVVGLVTEVVEKAGDLGGLYERKVSRPVEDQAIENEGGNKMDAEQIEVGSGEVCRYKNGRLVERAHYKDQKLDGPFEVYEDGALVISMTYRKGVLTGPFMQYAPNGYPLFRCHFADGELHGPSFAYDQSGALLEIKNYLHGTLDGEVITYYPSGAPLSHGQYVGGAKHGEFTQYDEQGLLVGSLYYEHDVLVDKQSVSIDAQHY
jgi:antitoxin component YwqK of YwqJK toxin-antitoxin module